MTAFIEGHGMRRFHGHVEIDEVPSVLYNPVDDPDSWKDFVELAKTCGAAFMSMESWVLEKEDLDEIIQRLAGAPYASEEDVEDARWLRTYLGKTGYVQLGFPYQGVMWVFEAPTAWYERYQQFVDLTEDIGGIPMDGAGYDEEP
ncbi:MAG: hypothetical protein H0X25_04950 [Acidobacteriales bacterium]|nr:hypothetical protein [Terriglobales bacterium]